MAMPVIQPSLTGGELAPTLFGRVDLEKFHVAVARGRNFFVDYRGGASNRAGTEFVGQCKDSTKANRLIPFNFNTTQTYALVFGDFTMRVVMDGGYVLESGTVATITGATQANPCVVTATNSFADGDLVYISGVVGMTDLNGRFFVLSGTSGTGFNLTDPITGANIDATNFGAYTSGGTAARVYTLTTPFAAADLALVKFTQNADTMTLTHQSYAPQQLTRTAHDAWTIASITFGSSVGAPNTPTVTASVTSGSTTYRYVVTGTDARGISESLPTASGECTDSATMSVTACHVTLSWTGGNPPYNVYRQQEVDGGAADAGSLYGYIGTTTDTGFVDSNITPDFSLTPPIGNNPFSSSNYPAVSTYYAGRQVFGGLANAPTTLEFSKVSDYLNMDYSSPMRDSDSIEADINSNEVNSIKHLVPVQSLLVLTAAGAWRVDGGGFGAPLTPATIQAVPQAYNGCSDVPPIVINYDILYVQSKGSNVHDLSYNFYVNVFTGTDITPLSSHLFYGHKILEWAWARQPHKIVWAVRDDGILLSLTYFKEQDVMGWMHHDTSGLIKSVCSIQEGDVDAVYLIVERLINGTWVQYVERMASRLMGAIPEYGVPADLDRAWFVDCGLQADLTYPAATLSPQGTGAPDANGVYNMAIVDANIIDGGSGYTAPTATIEDLAGSGSGASVTLTVSGGVITGVTIAAGGTYYQEPQITIHDDTGSGAVIAPILSNDVAMVTDSAVTVNVGDRVKVNSGWGLVRVVTDTTHFTVNVQHELLNTYPAAANAWSATTPDATLSGLQHLEGQTIVALGDGNVFTDLVVANGQVTLPVACSSRLAGLSYVGQIQSLYADIPGEQPTVQGRRKQISAVTVRVENSRGLAVGHDFNNMDEIKERDFQTMGQPILPITGDERIVLNPQYDVPGQVCIEQAYPLPATVLALIPEITVGDQ